MTTSLKFRPGEPDKRGNQRAFNKGAFNQYASPWQSHNRIVALTAHKKGRPLNQETLSCIFGVLHYLSSHAPKAVEAKWHQAAKRFERHHMGNPFRQSTKFHNIRTAGGWL